MNKNIIWLGIGAIGVYLLLSRKKASATNVEPTKDSDSISKEPRSQADCGEGSRFVPAQKAEEITLTKKDGTTEVVMKEAKPAMCVRIRQGGGLPLGENENNRYQNFPIGMSKELMDAILDLVKISDSSLREQHEKLVCDTKWARIRLTEEGSNKRNLQIRALKYVAQQRGVKLDCDINIKKFERNKISPVYDGNIKRLATGIN